MMAAAHAGLGWVIGMAAPASDRRLRIWCVAAALLPDLDALTLLFGGTLARSLYHTAGHNFFAGVLCMGAAIWTFRRAPTRMMFTALFLVALCFSLHLLIDAKLWGIELRLFWPLHRRGLHPQPLLEPGHLLAYVLVGLLVALPWALAFWKQVTPLEILSPRLDTLFLNLIRRKKYDCSVCGRKSNNRCATCTHPVCLRHAKIGWRFRVTCPSCKAGSAPKGTGAGVEDYVARELRFLRTKEAVRLDPEFAGFLHRKLTDGLRRLDDVPRTHPLWEGSDQRPTLAKLVDLSRTILKESPDDDESRWVVFADRILTSSPDLEYSVIEPAILRDFASIRWLVAAARWSFVFSGVDPVVSLRAPLESLGKSVGSLETFLQELGNDKDPAMKEAAAKCLDLFRGKNPFSGQTTS